MVWRVRDAHFGRLSGRVALTATAVLALGLATSCSALSGNSSDSSGGSNSGNLEKPTIKVGAIAGASSASLYIAADKGYFKQEGLNVQIVTTKNGSTALNQMKGGQLDITLANDVSGIQFKMKGNPIDLVFDGPSNAPHTIVISALPNSPIKTLKDLQGKNLGISSQKDAVFATLQQSLEAVNVDPKSVNYKTVPYGESEQFLQSHAVDATVTIEPYTTEAAEQLGARPVVDVFPAGSAEANIPNAGYFASEKFVKGNPKTLAAFQRAMVKGANDAANRQNVENAIAKHIPKLSKQVLDVMALPGFPSDLDPNRIQRVADLMQKSGIIKSHFDIRQMLAPFPTSS
ncbi:MAG TPA: ABC transporter substrate-binding protein [Pseudonocardiaceae bacterium]|jgi:NitT/TauT family transport system substrate-binding protein|nr:ABC transporter substrate-binding protein [Pseudonocardiaceae bacterium]